MKQCIKCGREIPEGELFCVECSLNPGLTTSESLSPTERYPIPKGKMQTPVPVKRVPVPAPPPVAEPPKKAGKGVVAALVIVILLLIASAVFQLWQYSDLQAERNRLRTKEADLLLRQNENEALQQQLDGLNLLLDQAQTTIAEQEAELEDLEDQISDIKSSQSQGQYNLATKQLEIEKLEDKYAELKKVCDELEEEKASLEEIRAKLEAALEAARPYKTKADFMDSYVVFVENDKSNYYHTYDCTEFSKSNFWAYSRKLAEAQGFTACPICDGEP